MNKRLNVALDNYNTLIAISKKAQALTKQSSKYVSEFNLPILGKQTKNSQKDIDNYFDDLNGKLLEYTFMELFATFEAIVIETIQNASGNMKSTLKEKYKGNEFINYTDRFVKNENDYGSLNRILKLLENKISSEYLENLSKIVKYRDKLAHGKRFHEDVILDSLNDTKMIMENILLEIT